MAASKFATHQFTIFVSLFTILFLILIGLFSRYSTDIGPLTVTTDGVNVRNAAVHPFNTSTHLAPLLHDTHAFVLIGFGFLVAFLRRYGFSAVSLNLLILAFTLEWAIIIRGFISKDFGTTHLFSLSLRDLAKADYTVATVLISFGALLGKLTPIQHVMIAFVETPVSILNEYLLINVLGVGDIGGSLVVHLFGAVFGIVASRILFRQTWLSSEHQGSIYHSSLFSLVGTLFLWAFWPSFNSVFAQSAAEQSRIVLNTFLALAGSTTTTFLVSQLLHKERRFNINHIASATLAGGVASGAVCNLYLSPFPALLTGIVAGAASVASFQKLTPMFAKKFNIHDTRGVFSLHGVPAIIGGLMSFIWLFGFTTVEHYGNNIALVYPLMHVTPVTTGTVNRTTSEQAFIQLAGIGLTILIAAIAGAITGVVARLQIWQQVRDKEAFADGDNFDVPSDFDFVTRVTSHIERVELTEHTERKQLLTNDVPVAIEQTTTVETTQ